MDPNTPQPAAPEAPQPPTAPTPAPPTPAGGTGKKLSKNTLIAMVVAAAVVLAGIAYGVFAYVSNTPESLIKAAVENSKNEKSLAATFKVTTGTEDNGVTVSGDVAVTTDPANAQKGEAIIGIGSGDKRVAFNALSLDGTLYLKLTNMENLGALLATFSSDYASADTPEVATALKNVNNQWFELTKDDVKSIAQSSGTDSVAGAVSPDDLKKVLDIYNQHSFVKVDKTYADEVVDGSNSAHFSLKVDKNELVKFLEAVKAANLSTIKVSDADIDDAKKTTDSSDVTLETWIARDTKKFKQFRMVDTEKGNEATFTLTFTTKLPTFDKLEKPTDVKPLSDFTTLLLGSSTLMY